MKSRRYAVCLLPIVVAFAFGLSAATLSSTPSAEDPVPFTDVKTQTAQFLGWERTLRLTPEQEEVRRAALEPLPAACCSDRNAHTCCCPCNLSRSVWGLSKKLIAEHGFSAERVREKVKGWFEFVNPGGFPGDTCYRAGGCTKSFARGGCGGMTADQVVF